MAGNMNGGSSYFKGLTKRDYIKKTQEIILAEGREAASIRRIAKEMGIPEYMAGRLSGADEKALRADAQTLKASLNTFKGPAPGKKDNDGSKDGGSGLLGMLRGMKGA